jgi:hypothetical protein
MYVLDSEKGRISRRRYRRCGEEVSWRPR